MVKSLNYNEGDCFLVPLREGGYARGVISRLNNQGIIFGYFFGPLIKKKNDVIVDGSLKPSLEILIGQFGDLGLLKNEWNVIGSIESWKRDEWPMPKFLRRDDVESTGVLCSYDEESLNIISEQSIEISGHNISQYPIDRLMGYGSVELKLTKLLK